MGTSGLEVVCWLSNPVHPHASGDIVTEHTQRGAATGSPPRKWGHPVLLLLFAALVRFTPTQVGTSSLSFFRSSASSVHPHASGDIILRGSETTSKIGSPPRKWGHPMSPRPLLAKCRFTPTQVGTSIALLANDYLRTVHPHASGDIKCRPVGIKSHAGSPPRKWGHPFRQHNRACHCRFTPTQVGTSSISHMSISVSSVHPHASGDILSIPNTLPHKLGSPPRKWGHLNLLVC